MLVFDTLAISNLIIANKCSSHMGDDYNKLHNYSYIILYCRLGKFVVKKVTRDKSLACFNFVKTESIVCTSTKELH